MKSQSASYVCEQPDPDVECLNCGAEFFKWQMPPDQAKCPVCRCNPYEPTPEIEPESPL